MNKFKFLLLTTIFLFVTFTNAQEADAWTIVDRCLPEPTTPPENWSFEGTILLGSDIGIHGINQDWETRRILAYRPNDTIDSYLSPDGRTWLTFQGETYCRGSCNSATRIISSLTVHNLTALNPESYQIDWHLFYSDNWKYPEGGRSIPILRWLTPSQIMYVSALQPSGNETPVIYDLTTDTTEVYETLIYQDDWHNISPDGTLVIDRVDNRDFTKQFFLSDPQDLSPIVEIPADFYPFNYYTLNVWSPDSQFFLASRFESQEADGSDNVSLWLMNRDGEAVYSILDSLIVGEPQLYLEIDWSPDGQYLTIFGNSHETAWLIDLQNRHSYNLCISDSYYSWIAWSPDSQQIAFQTYSWEEDQYLPLTIFEPATWIAYEVADNPDTWVIGWQAEEE